MNKRLALVAAALAGLAATPVVSVAATASQEKCYGIAKAGQNDCATGSGTHSCAGQAKADYVADEWKYVLKGTCQKVGGKTAPPASK